MEKNSSVILTPGEVEEVKAGRVPARLSATWRFTLDELKSIIESGNYSVTSWIPAEPGTESSST